MYRSTALRTVTAVTATAAVLATAAACGDGPISPASRQAIEDSCAQVYLLQDERPESPAGAAEAVHWGLIQSAVASRGDSRAEPLEQRLADMKRIIVGPDGRSANPDPDLAAFAAAIGSAAQECRTLEGEF